jgi:hypothetical protein
MPVSPGTGMFSVPTMLVLAQQQVRLGGLPAAPVVLRP